MSTNTEPESKKVAGETTPAPDTDEEPQNSLTQKFTDKEWAALKEFRVRVTHALNTFACNLLTATCTLSPSSRTSLRKRMMVRKARGPRPL